MPEVSCQFPDPLDFPSAQQTGSVECVRGASGREARSSRADAAVTIPNLRCQIRRSSQEVDDPGRR